MSATPLKLEKLDTTIRVRTESTLREKLKRLAVGKKKRFSSFMREELWLIVEREESSEGKSKRR